jgi:hypothetical protein
VDPILERIGAALLRDASAVVARVHRASGFPVFLVRWPELAPNDALAWWTGCNVAVVRVAEEISDEAIATHRARARLALLEQHAGSLPLRVLTDDERGLRLSEACIVTAALIRASGVVEGAARDHLLSAEAASFIRALALALSTSDRQALAHPPIRLAALLVGAGLRGEFPASDVPELHRKWSALARTVTVVRDSAPLAAANAVWKWATQARATPRWAMPRLRNADVAMARVKVLGTVAAGVLATDELNEKGFQFTPEQLVGVMEFVRQRPVVYLDHDRSRPPAMIALEAEYHCHGPREETKSPVSYGCEAEVGHHVSILVAARSQEGTARLEAGGGFSVGLELVPVRKT